MTINLYASRTNNLAEMQRRFASQFDGKMISCSWPDGWHQIVSRACEQAQQSCPQMQWHQIKEKFASLFMYYSDGSVPYDLADLRRGAALGIIKAALEESCRTCMSCSTPASRVVINHWHYTVCSDCRARLEHGR